MRVIQCVQRAIVISACFTVFSAAAAAADQPKSEWPCFHGPRRDNKSAETGLLKSWPKGGPKLLWKSAQCGRGYAGVSVAQGKLFTSGDFGREEFILALDLDGKVLWRTQNGKSWRGSTPGSRATPTYSQGRLYHMSPAGRLAALDAKTGKEIWAVDLKEVYGVRYGSWGLCENVVIEGDMLLCAPGGERGRIVALHKATGKPIWVNTTIKDRVAYCSPIVVTHNGVRQLISLWNTSVVGVSVRTGKLLWSHTHPSRYSQNVTTPLYHKGHVFVTSGHKAGGRLLRISPKSDSVRQVWFSEEFDNCHGGAMVLDGHIYGSGCRLYHKGLQCADFRTGKTVYRAEGLGKVSITYADGLLYCVDQKGNVSLVDATPQRAKVLGRFSITLEGKDHSLAHPVVCGGRLYIRQARNLYAYDVRASGQEAAR